jgi:[FeFe] hydrogenase H-cluster maturation GTPase HydF
MNRTPGSSRIHFTIFGKRNSGKSSLLNAITGQQVSVVSEVPGTTTDPVRKAMELPPLGPVIFTDTAGIDDEGSLGEKRVEKSLKALHSTDLAIYVTDIHDRDMDIYENTVGLFERFNIPFITVVNKIDKACIGEIREAEASLKDAIFVSAAEGTNMERLVEELVKKAEGCEVEPSMIADLVGYGGKVVMVVPIDSQAPKGRLILPQVQLIRDCLDHGIKSYVVRDTELPSALSDLSEIDLVVTDSQAFKKVAEIVPPHIKLTSFSIIMSRVKGDLEEFLKGVETISRLKNGDTVLVAESCTHNRTHEDIGTVKIPNGLSRLTGKKLKFEFSSGRDFPSDLKKYSLVIHCASCMFNRKTMQSRILLCREQGVPITNYGVVLAHITGILPKATEIFNEAKDVFPPL